MNLIILLEYLQPYFSLKNSILKPILMLKMTKNPLLNAISAIVYIIFIVLILRYGSKNIPNNNIDLIAPIAMISLFTLSAAIMAYVFGYYPLILFFDKKRKEAVNLFLKTTLVFGAITLGLLLILFTGLVG